MPSRPGERTIVPRWTETVGALMAEGAEVIARCTRCSANAYADLQRIARAKGPGYCLWDRSTGCRTIGCQGRVWFKAVHPNAGVRAVDLRGAHPTVLRSLHARAPSDPG